MAEWFLFAALFLLATIAAALIRCGQGPARIDRIMAVQLVGSGVMGVAVTLGAARRDAAMLDAGLIGTLLAAITVTAFARGMTAEGSAEGRGGGTTERPR